MIKVTNTKSNAKTTGLVHVFITADSQKELADFAEHAEVEVVGCEVDTEWDCYVANGIVHSSVCVATGNTKVFYAKVRAAVTSFNTNA